LVIFWAAKPAGPQPNGKPGKVIAADSSGVVVATANGSVRVTRLALEGDEDVEAANFLQRTAIKPGDSFEEKK
jgi:methionyl-tRNA formyltransferase